MKRQERWKKHTTQQKNGSLSWNVFFHHQEDVIIYYYYIYIYHYCFLMFLLWKNSLVCSCYPQENVEALGLVGHLGKVIPLDPWLLKLDRFVLGNEKPLGMFFWYMNRQLVQKIMRKHHVYYVSFCWSRR